MALAQIVPILITLQGDNSSTVFTYSLPNIYQAAPGGSIPFGTNGVVPSSVVINNPPYTVTSSTVDANGNITITFTSAPPTIQFSIEIDLVYNSGRAISGSSTFSENVVITGGTIVATQGTAANLNATVVFPSAQHVIVDSGGGGGTQYITGTAETTPTGTMALGWDGTTVKALPLDGSGYLKVNVAAGSSGNAAAGTTGSPVPTSASYTGYNVSGNLVGVSALDPLPVTVENSSIAVTGTFWQTTQPISGTVAVSGSVPVTGTFWQATQPVSGSGNFTVVQSSGSNLHVDVDNSVAVTGTFWQTTQPISGTVAVSGTVVVSNSSLSELTFTNYGSPAHECLNVYVINPLTATLTETQIGVTQVTSPWVTDIWTNAGIGAVPNTFLATGIFDASTGVQGVNVITAGAISATTYNSLAVGVVGLSGNIANLTDDGNGNLNTVIKGEVEIGGVVEIDGVVEIGGVVEISGNSYLNSKTNPIFMEIADGTNSSALTAFGTAPATSTHALSTNSQLVALVSSTPTALTATGTSLNVNITGGSSGNAAASATGSAVPADASYTGFNSGGNLVGVSSSNPLPITVENSSIAVTGTFYQTTQPVSGTITANAGTGTFNIQSNASVNLTQLNGSALGAPSNYGTSPGAVAVQGVNAYVTNTVPVTLSSTTITGTVAVTQNTSPWIIAGAGTAGSPGSAVLTVQGIGSGTAIPVSGTFWQTTQPVSGTVAVSSVSGSVAVTGTFWQATQPISGTVGVSGTVAVTQSTSPWVVSNPTLSEMTFSSYGSPATENLNVYVVNPITATFTETQIGVTQSTSPWVISATSSANTSGNPIFIEAISGSTTAVTQGTAANLNATVVGTGTFAVQAACTGTVAVSSVTGVVEVSATTSANSSGNPIYVSAAITSTDISTNIAQIGGATMALGQQVAASSVPVVLTSAQISALTPLSTVAVSSVSGVVEVSATTSANSSGNPIYVEAVSGSTTIATQATGTNLHTVIDSGTITTVTTITNAVTVVGDAASGSAVAGNPVLVAGSDGTDARTLSTSTTGQLHVIVDTFTPTNVSTNVAEFGGSSVTIGQQLATASIPVILPSATITTLTPPSASAIGTSVSADLLIGTQAAGSSVPVALPSATITTLTPPSASAIATALSGLAVTNAGTFAVQAATNADTTIGGTTAPSKGFLALGKTADGTPAYDALPLAAGGGSIVTSGTVAVSAISGVVEVSATGSVNSSGNPIYVSAAISSTNISTNIAQVGGATMSLGQQLAAASVPVVLTAAQITTLTPLSTIAVSGVSGVVEVGPTGSANTKTNPFFNEITDGTNAMGVMANFGTTPGAVTAVNTNASLFQGTTAVGSGAPLQVSLANTGANGTALSVTATLAAATTNVIGTVRVIGNAGAVFDAATGAAVPANAVQMGVIAKVSALPTATSDAFLIAPMADKFGRQVVLPQAMRDLVGTKWTQIASSSAETTIVASVSSVFLDITGIQITNQTATAVTVTIKDSTGGTTRKTYDLAANGGIVVHFSPPLPQSAVTNNWTATLSSAAVTVDINVDYIQNK